MLQAEAHHRGHAIIEQVFADLKAGPLAHLPSGRFAANNAWLVLAAMAFNLTRAAGALASLRHAKTTTGAIRRQLISVPARLAHSARRLVLHCQPSGPGSQHGNSCSPKPAGRPKSSRSNNQAMMARQRTSCGKAGQTGECPTPPPQKQRQDHQLTGTPMRPVDPG
jgi:hypothetical protein